MALIRLGLAFTLQRSPIASDNAGLNDEIPLGFFPSTARMRGDV